MPTVTNIDDALSQWVPAQAALVAVLGADGTGTPAAYPGLYPEYPTDILPSLTWRTLTSSDPAPTHSGPSGLFVARYDFTCRAATLSAAQLVARTLIAALNCFKGTIDGYLFGPCFLLQANLRETYNEDQAVFSTSMDWKIYDNG